MFDKMEAQEHIKQKHGYCRLCELQLVWRELGAHINKEHFMEKVSDDLFILENIDPEYFRRLKDGDWK